MLISTAVRRLALSVVLLLTVVSGSLPLDRGVAQAQAVPDWTSESGYVERDHTIRGVGHVQGGDQQSAVEAARGDLANILKRAAFALIKEFLLKPDAPQLPPDEVQQIVDKTSEDLAGTAPIAHMWRPASGTDVYVDTGLKVSDVLRALSVSIQTNVARSGAGSRTQVGRGSEQQVLAGLEIAAEKVLPKLKPSSGLGGLKQPVVPTIQGKAAPPAGPAPQAKAAPPASGASSATAGPAGSPATPPRASTSALSGRLPGTWSAVLTISKLTAEPLACVSFDLVMVGGVPDVTCRRYLDEVSPKILALAYRGGVAAVMTDATLTAHAANGDVLTISMQNASLLSVRLSADGPVDAVGMPTLEQITFRPQSVSVEYKDASGQVAAKERIPPCMTFPCK
jgi:hypothetical protein